MIELKAESQKRKGIGSEKTQGAGASRSSTAQKSVLGKPNVLELDNPLAARILADPDIAVYLKPFMRQTLTVKAAAEICKLPIQTMHYRMEQMVKAGLLAVVDEEERRGRPIKHYHATAEAFQISINLIPNSILQALTDHASWKVQFERSLSKIYADDKYQEQMVVYLNEDGLMVWGSHVGEKEDEPNLLGPEFPAVFNLWSGGLRLDRADAKALQRQLWELYEQYAHRGGSEKYVIHLGLAPNGDRP